MNPDLFYINLFTALVFGAVIFLIVFVLAKYKRKPTYRNQPIEQKTVYGSFLSDEPVILDQDLKEKLRSETKRWGRETEILVQKLTTTQAERDNYRGLWEQSVQRGKDKAAEFDSTINKLVANRLASENERDAAQLFADSLREYLDRALALIRVQNEQIQQLMPKPKGWNLKVYPRDENGRITTPNKNA